MVSNLSSCADILLYRCSYRIFMQQLVITDPAMPKLACTIQIDDIHGHKPYLQILFIRYQGNKWSDAAVFYQLNEICIYQWTESLVLNEPQLSPQAVLIFSGCECKTLHIKWLSRINPTFVITLHADVPSNSGARPSPGTMLTTKTNLLTFSSFNSCRWNRMDQLMSSKDRRDLLKFLCTFECWSSTNENLSVCFVSYCTRFLFV